MRSSTLGFLAIALSSTACGSLNVDARGNVPGPKDDLPAATEKKGQESIPELPKLSAHQKALIGGVYELKIDDIKGKADDVVGDSSIEFFSDNTFVIFSQGTFVNRPNFPIVMLMKGTYELSGDVLRLKTWTDSSCPESLHRTNRPGSNPDDVMLVAPGGTLSNAEGEILRKKAGVTMTSPRFKAATVGRLNCGPGQSASWPSSF